MPSTISSPQLVAPHDHLSTSRNCYNETSRVPRAGQSIAGLLQGNIEGSPDSINYSGTDTIHISRATGENNLMILDGAQVVAQVDAEHVAEEEPVEETEDIQNNYLSDNIDHDDDEMIEIETEKVPDAQTELRQKIVVIQGNGSISASEKAILIQELMARPWLEKQKNEQKKDSRVTNFLSNKAIDYSLVTDGDKVQTHYNSQILGCKHYQRSCKLQAHCCGKWDTCRFCHDEVSDHTITRNLTETMMCMYCWHIQPAGQVCTNVVCGKVVSVYYCKDCKLWDNDPRKTIYHCHDCGICRIGKGLGIDYFHCPTCNVCMAIGLKGRHKCIERNLESDCPICGEYMFTSTSTVIFMPCGHCMHHKCHQQHIHTSYQCPTCLKSLADMSEYYRRIDISLLQQEMPTEYRNQYSNIYCNDCEKKSTAKFHFMYHKCGHCFGYNTKLINTMAGLPLKAIIAPDIRIHEDSESLFQSSTSMGRFESSTSMISADSGSFYSDAQYTGYWCHHCQGPAELVAGQEVDKCTQCLSDFVEMIE